MAHNIHFEVFPTKRNIDKMRYRLVDIHGFSEKQNHLGSYFYTETSSIDSWQIKTILDKYRYKYRCFDNRYERDNKYRKTFFENNRGPYHCAYCGKKLKASQLEVDHLIPVAKAKTSLGVRTWLQICGIRNVNDPKNLVASCEKCNKKKSDNMGVWVIKGAIGRHKAFWIIRNLLLIATIFLGLFLMLNSEAVISVLKEMLETVFNNLSQLYYR